MDTRRTLILVGLAAVTFALGAAAVSGSMTGDAEQAPAETEEAEPAEPTSMPASQEEAEEQQDDEEEEKLPRDHPGVVVERFEAELSESLETGQLDLRVDRGNVLVIGWDQPAYNITVLQDEVPEDRIEDQETNVEVADASNDEHLDIAITAERSGTHNVQIDAERNEVLYGDDVQLAIVAYVPQDLLYESIYACSGQDNYLNEAFHEIGELAGVTRSGYEACLDAPDAPQAIGNAQIMNGQEEDRERVDRLSGLENIEGEDALFDVRYGDLVLSDVDVDNATAVTRYGQASLDNVEAENLAVDSRYGNLAADDVDASSILLETRHGNVNATGLQADEVRLETRYGNMNVDLDADTAALHTRHGQAVVAGAFADLVVETRHGDIHLAPSEVKEGQIVTESRHGSITAELPEDADTGYNVVGESDNGDVTIELKNAEVVASDEEEGHQHARTSGYDEMPVQIDMTSETRYGDIFVVEGEMDQALEEEDQEEGDEEPPQDDDSLPLVSSIV